MSDDVNVEIRCHVSAFTVKMYTYLNISRHVVKREPLLFRATFRATTLNTILEYDSSIDSHLQ